MIVNSFVKRMGQKKKQNKDSENSGKTVLRHDVCLYFFRNTGEEEGKEGVKNH